MFHLDPADLAWIGFQKPQGRTERWNLIRVSSWVCLVA